MKREEDNGRLTGEFLAGARVTTTSVTVGEGEGEFRTQLRF